MTDSLSLSSLSRALKVLDAFYVTDVDLTLTQIAERAHLPKTTTHRFVTDLVEWGGLERTPTGFRLGMKLFELGHLVPQQRTLRDIALPHLRDLYESTRLTVNLAMSDGNEVIYVEKISNPRIQLAISRQGGRLPLHATALGKAMLAFASADVIAAALRASLPQLTPQTITEPDQLRSELLSIRQNHLSFDYSESTQGVICVGTPLFNDPPQRSTCAIAAISVSGLESAANARSVAPALLATGVSISRALIYANRKQAVTATHSRQALGAVQQLQVAASPHVDEGTTALPRHAAGRLSPSAGGRSRPAVSPGRGQR